MPYVQNVTTSSAVIMWKTDDNTVGQVSWGSSASLGSTQSTSRGKRHEVTLPNLSANTEYFYQVAVDGKVVSSNVSFRTAKTSQQQQFSFIAFGDSGQWNPFMLQIASQIQQRPVDLLIHTGDVVYPKGEESKYDVHCFSQYKGFLRRSPMFPCIGNHDDRTNRAQPYLNNWSLPTNNQQGDERYYSFGWGHVRFISINTQDPFEAGSPQHQFIENELATASAAGFDWVIPYMHKGPYSSSRHGENDVVKRHLVPLFERYGVKLVFSGHDHDYERTHPINGVTYIVTGGGGQLLYPKGTSSFTAVSKFSFHFVKVDVDGNSLTLQAINQNGNVIDQHTITR